MRPEVEAAIDAFMKQVRDTPRRLLLVDYDGTLAPFQERRDQAFPYPGVSPLLEEIASNCATRVVIVSGRDARESAQLLDFQPHLEVWGLHGMQRQSRDGTIESTPLDSATLDGLSDADRWLGYQHLRHHAEFKRGSIAVHWRGLGDQEAEDIRQAVMLGWAPIAENAGLALLDFDGGVEIRPAEPDKGDAVRTVLAELPDVPAAYLGDDMTDEPAFRAMKGKGLSILVRPESRPTAAQLWLTPPEEVLTFLSRWVEACQGRTNRGHEMASGVR